MNNKKIVFFFLIIFILITVIPIFSVNAKECVIDADIIFLLDTSGSMSNEWRSLCSIIDDVAKNLKAQNVVLSYRIFALENTYCNINPWSCPPDPDTCSTGILGQSCTGGVQGEAENWGQAIVDVSPGPWTAPIKIIMPISDEGPYCGDGCDANDTTSINNAINAANANGIYVFPFQGNGASSCCSNRMNQLVIGTVANDQKFTWGGTPASMANDIYAAVMMAAWDGDGDGYMTIDCPCDPDNPPPGIIGCYDCDDADAAIIQECFYGGLVPCGRLIDDPSTSIDETAHCTLCHLFVLMKRIVDEIVMPYGSLLAVLIVVIGGLMFITAGGDPGRIRSAKNIMKAAGIGLVIILIAWLIVDTIITFLTPAGSPLQQWHTINCPVP